MQKNILVWIALLGLVPVAWSQIERPVSWVFSSQPIENGRIELQFKATIQPGWHLYSQFIEEGGPIPTGFFFEESSAYTRQGVVKEFGKLHKAYDPTFEMDLAYFDQEVTFSQVVTLTGEKAVVAGYLEFMVCNDEKCLPPEAVDFSLAVTSPTTKAAPASPSAAPASESPIEKDPEKVVSPIDEAPGTSLFSPIGPSSTVDPVKWTFDLRPLDGGTHEALWTADVQAGWKIYSQFIEEGGPVPTSFDIQAGAYELIGNIQERGIKHSGIDEIFNMQVTTLEGQVEFAQTLRFEGEAVPIVGELVYMACEEGRCLPPAVVSFAIGGKTAVTKEAASELLQGLTLTTVDLDNPASECGSTEKSGISVWKDFLAGFLGGLFALLTPCVFPMIPLTVSFFTKSSQDKRKGITNAILYGISIFGIYALASAPFHLIEGIEGNVFNLIATDPWLNLGFFVVFVAFAISFFGYYDIALPSSFANRAYSASTMGNLAGIFFMALTLCIVSFSCTGPILGSLVAVSASGSVSAWNLTAAMAGFGIALALPFGLFAAFPGWLNSLPKSGSWLTTVKVMLGFVELALAVKFLSNADLVEHWGLVKRETFFLLWIMIGIAMILYLLGKIKFPHDTPPEKISASRWVGIAAIGLFVGYLIPGLFNTEAANRQLLSGFPPPMFYSWYERSSGCPLDLPCYKDYEEGLAVAKATGKPIMLDFTGWACVNCRRMEENVWVNPAVFKKLSEEYVLISLYVDDRAPLDEPMQGRVRMSTGSERKVRTVGDKWAVFEEENFHQNTQPLYVLLSPEGALLNQPVGYTPNKLDYLEFLQCGLDALDLQKTQALVP